MNQHSSEDEVRLRIRTHIRNCLAKLKGTKPMNATVQQVLDLMQSPDNITTSKPAHDYELVTPKLATNRKGDIIRCDDPKIMARIMAMLHTEAVAYVVGHPDELAKITPDNPDNEMCGFAENLTRARNMTLKDEVIHGIFVLPL